MSLHHSHTHHTQADNPKQASSMALVSVCTALLLIVAKAVIYMLSGSVSVLASLTDSATDLAASATNFFALKHSEEPPDWNHQWGHGKAESLAALGQALLIGGSAIFVCVKAFDALHTAHQPDHIAASTITMLLSALVSLGLSTFLRAMGRKYNSIALAADASHYTSDVLTNGATCLSLAAAYFFQITWLDPLVGMGIAWVLLQSAFEIAKASMHQLMDTELSEGVRRNIEHAIMSSDAKVISIVSLKTRQSGQMTLLDVEIALPEDLSFREVHKLCEHIRTHVQTHIGQSMVHVYPVPQVYNSDNNA